MGTVVALFADESSARQGIDRLVASGVPPSCVHSHRRGESPRNAVGVIADEYATGGFFSNFANLLDGLLGTSRAAGTAATYADVVRHEGIAVSVEGTALDTTRVEDLLRAAGATSVSRTME